MKKLLVIALLCTITSKNFAQTDEDKIEAGKYLQFLLSHNNAERDSAFTYINQNTKKIDPYTLMFAGNAMYHAGYKDSSLYWYYLGSLRARYLISLDKEPSGSALFDALELKIGQKISSYAQRHQNIWSEKIIEILKWDKENPVDPFLYMDKISDTSHYIPRDKWQSSYDTVRNSFLELSQQISQKK